MYQLHHRQPKGHALLVAAPNVHAEMIEKLRISAGLAFESFAIHQMPVYAHAAGFKQERINDLWLSTANEVQQRYRWPWLWLEPDCIPLKHDWLDAIADAYHAQPQRYMGSHMKFNNGQSMCLSRVAVYPTNAASDLKPFCEGNGPFNLPAGLVTINRSTKSPLIQNMLYDGNREKIRAEAVVLHGDKEQVLIPVLRQELRGIATQSDLKKAINVISRPFPENVPVIKGNGKPGKIDMRTKEGRRLKELHTATLH